MTKFNALLILFFLIVFFPVKTVFADISLGTALPIEINEKVQDGDIISSKEGGGYARSNIENAPFMYGVVALDPAFYLYDRAAKNQIPVITTGRAYIRVSTEKGAIKRGDGIAASKTPGVGVKSLDNGYVIGIASEPYESANPKQIGKILVAVDPRFLQMNNNLVGSLLTLPRLSFAATPSNALRYLVAGIIAVASFLIGFRFFGRASLEGVKAIGRNPLARSSIIFVVAVNTLLTIAVMLVGFGIAYAVLVL